MLQNALVDDEGVYSNGYIFEGSFVTLNFLKTNLEYLDRMVFHSSLDFNQKLFFSLRLISILESVASRTKGRSHSPEVNRFYIYYRDFFSSCAKMVLEDPDFQNRLIEARDSFDSKWKGVLCF